MIDTSQTSCTERKVKRYRRGRSAKVHRYNAWDQTIEVGDLLVTVIGGLLRAEEPGGYGKKNAGELYIRLIDPPEEGLVAEIIDGEVWWCSPHRQNIRTKCRGKK